MGKDLVPQRAIRCLLTYKEYVVEIVDSIIKETNLEHCVDQIAEDLGALGLFDLSRVCLSQTMFLCAICPLFY